MHVQGVLESEHAGHRIVFVDGVSGIAFEEHQARVAELERPMTGARERHLCRVKCESLIGRCEQFYRIRAATGEQHAVVGKQSSSVSTARDIQLP